MNQRRVLVGTGTATLRKLLRMELVARGYTVCMEDTSQGVLEVMDDCEPHFLLLDVDLPVIGGIELCKRLRVAYDVPILMVSAVATPQVKIRALDAGADDYVTAPLDMDELVARMRAVARRVGVRASVPADFIACGDIAIDVLRREVRRGTEKVRLTKTEFNLLRELASHAGKVLTYDHLLDTVWGEGSGDAHPIHVHVSNLRRKLQEQDPDACSILAVPGVGYRLQLDTAQNLSKS